jgi:hypothetical protein
VKVWAKAYGIKIPSLPFHHPSTKVENWASWVHVVSPHKKFKIGPILKLEWKGLIKLDLLKLNSLVKVFFIEPLN